MTRAIYSIKTVLFRSQYNFRKQQEVFRWGSSVSYGQAVWTHLKSVSIFVTCRPIYVRYWFQCPSATGASWNYLDLLHELFNLFLYSDKDVTKAATTAFDCHLWYLSEHLITFAFFNEKKDGHKEKRLIVAALRQNVGSEDPLKRIYPFKEPHSLHNFVTILYDSSFFKILKLDEQFLQHDLSKWDNPEQYKRTQDTCHSVKVYMYSRPTSHCPHSDPHYIFTNT